MYEQDGALWFRSTDFGDDKDRVVIRSNGEPTYFASDIGYVLEKFSRGFDELIYIWGADHHGTVARLKNAAQALGHDRDAVNVLLIAWVRFVRDGEEVSMSKRSGEFVTLDELLAEVGVDAARWFFASRAPSTGIDFDIELARKQSSENPVYYVQYAHARISSILRKAADSGLSASATLVGGLAGDEVALGLAKDLLSLPDIVRDAADERETQSITTFATELATRFHAFYRDRHVVDTERPANVRGAPRARGRNARHARRRAGPPGHLRARLDVARGAGRISPTAVPGTGSGLTRARSAPSADPGSAAGCPGRLTAAPSCAC